jgi:hypothetical protein
MSEGYNGWTNYETWLVKLWMDNDSGSQDYYAERARECYEGAGDEGCISRRDVARLRLADLMDEECAEQVPELPGVYGDLLASAISEVNWNEIAGHYIDAVLEEVSDAN